MAETFADRVAELCYSFYETCRSTGKPQRDKDEWTPMSAVVLVTDTTNVEVVSMATGSKCVGQSKMSRTGDILNDSHAEVLARRAFTRYLYGELLRILRGKDSRFLYRLTEKPFLCDLKPGVKACLFSSHTPCGDASIFPKSSQYRDSSDMSDVGVIVTQTMADCMDIVGKKQDESLVEFHNDSKPLTAIGTKRKHYKLVEFDSAMKVAVSKSMKKQNGLTQFGSKQKKSKSNSVSSKNSNIIQCNTSLSKSDIFRTGAKCVSGKLQDHYQPGVDYHTVNALRTKPGRGDRTISMSCSDKIARWHILGCQGALLSHFLQPIRFTDIVIGNCPYSEDAMERAIISRFHKHISEHSQSQTDTSNIHVPCQAVTFHQSTLPFKDGGFCQENRPRISACPSAIIWYASDVPHGSCDVAVNGRRIGVTKKNQHLDKARCGVCPKEMFICFKQVLANLPDHTYPDNLRSGELKTYWDYKSAAMSYQTLWKQLRVNTEFKTWIRKPRDYLEFIT